MHWWSSPRRQNKSVKQPKKIAGKNTKENFVEADDGFYVKKNKRFSGRENKLNFFDGDGTKSPLLSFIWVKLLGKQFP